MRILSVIGTRPQLIKAAALSPVLRTRHDEILVDTGQHYDEPMAGVFFTELGLAEPGPFARRRRRVACGQTAAMLIALEPVIERRARPTRSSSTATRTRRWPARWSAAKLGVPVAHVEAGLRSFDRRMPEEINRVVADHLSRWLFAPTRAAVDNLAAEGITDGVELVGDLMQRPCGADRARDPRPGGPRARPGRGPAADARRLPVRDDPSGREPRARRDPGVGRAAPAVARADRPVVLALHPGTRVALEASGEDLGPDVRVTGPLGYRASLTLQLHAAAVLTDLGGIQREAGWLGVPCLVLRVTTEWVELLADSGRTDEPRRPRQPIGPRRRWRAGRRSTTGRRSLRIARNAFRSNRPAPPLAIAERLAADESPDDGGRGRAVRGSRDRWIGASPALPGLPGRPQQHPHSPLDVVLPRSRARRSTSSWPAIARSRSRSINASSSIRWHRRLAPGGGLPALLRTRRTLRRILDDAGHGRSACPLPDGVRLAGQAVGVPPVRRDGLGIGCLPHPGCLPGGAGLGMGEPAGRRPGHGGFDRPG